MWGMGRISRAPHTHCRGFSIVEVTIILTMLSILTAAAAPAVDDYVNQAKLVRAHHDVSTLSVSLLRLFSDTAAQSKIEHGWATYDLLVGGGSIPASSGAAFDSWTATPGDTVGLLDDQLLNNTPGYTAADALHFGGAGWRGAYLQQRVAPDPWGYRYALNMSSLRKPGLDTVVLTAGPNGVIESLFEVDGLPTGGDDIVASVSSSGY